MKRSLPIILICLCFIISLAFAGCHKADMADVDAEEVATWFAIDEQPPPSQGDEGVPIAEEGEEEAPPVPLPDEPGYALQELRLVRLDGTELELSDRPIPLRVSVRAKLSRALSDEERSQFESDFGLKDAAANIVSGAFEWSAANDEARFTLVRNLKHATLYSMQIAGSDHSFTTMVKGDIDGDGYADAIVSETGHDSDRGRVWFYGGKPLNQGTFAGVSREGENKGDRFGHAVDFAGDINGDGYEDVAVGAPGFDKNDKSDMGKFYLYRGPDLDLAGYVYSGAAGAKLGQAVAGCDLDGDGLSDVVAGAPEYPMYKGRVVVMMGGLPYPKLGTKLDGHGTGSQLKFGSALACLDDSDGDGSTDLAIGSPSYGPLKPGQGRVSIHRGAELARVTEFYGEAAGDALGFSIAPIEDLGSDRRTDLIAGAPGAAGRGAVYLYQLSDNMSASPYYAKATWPATDADMGLFGFTVVAVPDMSGDGKQDVLVGAPSYKAGKGAVFIVEGAPQMSKKKFRYGTESGLGLGTALAYTSNMNGPGVMMGEPGRDEGKGRVIVTGFPNIETVLATGDAGDLKGDMRGMPIRAH
ncbi:MAG: VCBS repeat-containing protein [Proteobacteria bacterium]|nr:VCBS repeat-containing protein [Pseudomonadota bacterium]